LIARQPSADKWIHEKEKEAKMEIKVYDYQGNRRDMAYLKGKYGDFIIQPAAAGDGPSYEISTLREKVSTAATLVVRIVDENGAPLEGIRVAWYWPDAPEDPNAGPLGGVLPQMRPNRCVTGSTNAAGDVGFGMGRGAYYFLDRGEIGPHATWVHGSTTRSELILGLGMIAGTNHDHFDVEFTRLENGPGPGPGPEPGECPKEEILAEMAEIESAVGEIRAAVSDIEASIQTVRQLLADVG
jgi:hypothetical protein